MLIISEYSYMVRKPSFIRDTLGMVSDKGGLYAIYPFDNINRDGFGLYKIGMAKESLHDRCDHYSTYFPDKFIIVSLLVFLEYPPEVYANPKKYQSIKTIRKSKQNPDGGKKFIYNRYIFEREKACHKFLLDKGSTQLYSNGRVRNPQVAVGDTGEPVKISKKGATEWFYTKEEWIKEWFELEHKKLKQPRTRNGPEQTKVYLRPLSESVNKLPKTNPVKDKFIGETSYNLKNIDKDQEAAAAALAQRNWRDVLRKI